MQYTTTYQSPLGKILLAADNIGLTGLWFENQKFYPACTAPEYETGDVPVLADAKRWLDSYFAGQRPDFMPAVHMLGTPFQLKVWEILQTIPYGKTVTYREIARKIAAGQGLARMSAQAVGGAVGRNKISIIVPCHRVIGSDNSLTGYAGGIDTKEALLRLEGAYPLPGPQTAD
ncbi:MAG: methylated-DNA--[protein]-cysteine S-methyltransferase [Anaerovibrio sp.]|nr:methylated-DNA--[protein]-cysteine S-methyltransferase [Anaerovibrio sp.]